MALVSYEYERSVRLLPDLGYVTFVVKIQKAKTRKDKDYFVLRATVPKEVAEKIDAKPGDYLFFKAKKAQWYHMLDWTKMETTWEMLPSEIKVRAILEGLPYPGLSAQMTITNTLEALSRARLGSTSPTANPSEQLKQIMCMQTKSGDINGSGI
jgi:hypothetical protein